MDEGNNKVRKATTFRDLVVWRRTIELGKAVYKTTQTMPNDERYGLTQQMRRAAVSIPSNIAEGNARRSRQDYIRFLVIARGSLAELETQLIIAEELKMLRKEQTMWDLIGETTRMLQSLINSLSHH